MFIARNIGWVLVIHRHAIRLLAVAISLMLAHPVSAQERLAVREGFSLPGDGSARILLMRTSIQVGAQSTAGLFEPNADWTEQARANSTAALTAAQAAFGYRLVELPEPIGAEAARLAEYRALFSLVAEAVVTYQFFRGNRLPTKKREGSFNWTLGAGIGDMPGAASADYALFVETKDHYGLIGRKALQLMAAGMFWIPVRSDLHKGFAELVDLKTGNLVWLNADREMGGDVRTIEEAQKRVAQLLEGFPLQPMTLAAAR